MKLLSRTIVLSLILLPMGAFAQSNRSSELTVVAPSHLPEAAQMVSESMFLRPTGGGSTYLYLEQHSRNRIVVLDVTHPAHVQQVAVVPTDGASFDFVRPLGSSAALVCFRDNSGSGVVQFRKAKSPILVSAPELKQSASAEEIGTSGLLITNEPRVPADRPEHDVQIVDYSTPGAPTVLATAHLVYQRLVDPGSGAHFLLGVDGLTVVRQQATELEYENNMRSTQ